MTTALAKTRYVFLIISTTNDFSNSFSQQYTGGNQYAGEQNSSYGQQYGQQYDSNPSYGQDSYAQRQTQYEQPISYEGFNNAGASSGLNTYEPEPELVGQQANGTTLGLMNPVLKGIV